MLFIRNAFNGKSEIMKKNIYQTHRYVAVELLTLQFQMLIHQKSMTYSGFNLALVSNVMEHIKLSSSVTIHPKSVLY